MQDTTQQHDADIESTAPEAASEGDSAAKPAGTPPAEPVREEEKVELVREGMEWYVLRVAANMEERVREALDRKVKIEQLGEKINRILVPTLKEKRMKAGQARVYHKRLYPGYVFVEMATEADGKIPEDVWFMIKETTGVGDFISSGGKPTPMGMKEVEEMMAVAMQRDEETPALANIGFKRGDKVRVTEGAFENFEGVVDEIDSQKGRVRVIATIFGRETPIDIEYWQIETI